MKAHIHYICPFCGLDEFDGQETWEKHIRLEHFKVNFSALVNALIHSQLISVH